MPNAVPTTPQWICDHCHTHLVNGDCTETDTCTPGSGDEHDPLRLFEGLHISDGMLNDQHSCGRENGQEVDECDCESNPFSWSQCDGCGTWDGGQRAAVTGWIQVSE